MAQRPLTFRPGDVLAGKYRVDRLIGQGGMGVVVAATHVALEQRVALKILLPDLVDDEQLVARFVREAKASAKIGGAHVARVYDVGTLDDATPFIVLELLEGVDLGEKLRADGPLSAAETADVVIQACHALAQAHALGIVHRDVKPANLFLAMSEDGTSAVKVLDFGISKAAAAEGDVSVTKTNDVFGSPMYMSPEQIRAARDVDARSDVWSLGIVLFELLTGRAPFDETSPMAVAGAILHGKPARVRDARPEIPATLERIVDRCLQKERCDRFASVREVAEALRPFATERGRTVADSLGLASERVAGASRRPSQPAESELESAKTLKVEGDEDKSDGSWAKRARSGAGSPTRRLARSVGVVVVAVVAVSTVAIAVNGVGARRVQPTPAASERAASRPPADTVSAAPRPAPEEPAPTEPAGTNETAVAPPPSAAATRGARTPPKSTIAPPRASAASSGPAPTPSAAPAATTLPRVRDRHGGD